MSERMHHLVLATLVGAALVAASMYYLIGNLPGDTIRGPRYTIVVDAPPVTPEPLETWSQDIDEATLNALKTAIARDTYGPDSEGDPDNTADGGGPAESNWQLVVLLGGGVLGIGALCSSFVIAVRRGWR